jgi:hypothetical protein
LDRGSSLIILTEAIESLRPVIESWTQAPRKVVIKCENLIWSSASFYLWTWVVFPVLLSSSD